MCRTDNSCIYIVFVFNMLYKIWKVCIYKKFVLNIFVYSCCVRIIFRIVSYHHIMSRSTVVVLWRLNKCSEQLNSGLRPFSWLFCKNLDYVILQDAVEIMKESLYDKYVDEHGLVDFGRSGGMSQQKEAKRFLSALNKQSELQQKDCFTISVWT